VSEPASERTTLHRYAHRAAYDRPAVDGILDQGIVCHVGLQTDRGFPVVIPLAYGRVDDVVYLHGSRRPAASFEAPARLRWRSA
jgi:nitroimidazol reductase NimA-like FMN-containing flavoprotein (pyridoxamine 5'-phosphate oxidase superfamily)